MKTMSRLWTLAVVSAVMGVTLFWATPAKAVPLSNTNISWSTFLSWTDGNGDGNPDPVPGFPDISFPYEFAPAGVPLGDGVFWSGVYQGTGAASGLYAYVYQIQVLRAPNIEGVSLVFITDPTLTPVGGTTSFYIGSGSPNILSSLLGNYAPTSAHWLSVAAGGEPTLRFNQINVPLGGTSYIFGTFSPLPPTTVDVTLRDATQLIVRPLAYVPTPEPSAFVLLGMSLLAVPLLRRRVRGKA